MVGLLGRVISSLQGLYLHRTTQHRKTRTNIHALSGIWTRDPVHEQLSFLYVPSFNNNTLKELHFCGSIPDSYAWGHRIESWWSNFFFHVAAMLLFYIKQRIIMPKFCIFRKSTTIQKCMTLLQVALVWIPSHKFVSPPNWCYLL
jgi:hypothetical protein